MNAFGESRRRRDEFPGGGPETARSRGEDRSRRAIPGVGSNSERSRLAIFTNVLDYGGAEVLIVEMALRFKKQGWDVAVVSLFPPRAFVAELQAGEVEVHNLGLADRRTGPLLAPLLVKAVFRLTRFLQGWRPDVLHCHLVPANLIGRVAGVFSGVPVVVCTAHSTDEGGMLRNVAYRVTDALCDVTTYVSREALADGVRDRRAPADRALYVPNGVDTVRFARHAQTRRRLREGLGVGGTFVWLAAGRLIPLKDWPGMLRAFERVPGADREAVLLIAGEGPLEGDLKALIQQLGLSRRVQLLGIRRDVADLMNAADAFVMSSRLEGLPMVLLEAAASGLPIVATSVGGTAEIVEDGITGFLAPPGDSRALAGAMERLLALTEAQRSEMGSAGRRRIEKFYSLDSTMQLWVALYRELQGVEGRP